MKTFDEAIKDAFAQGMQFDKMGNHSFEFGDGFELTLEKLMWDNQYYLALYKDQNLILGKIPIKPGKE